MCLLRMLAFQPVQNMSRGEVKTQKKKINKNFVEDLRKQKKTVNKPVAQAYEINSASWTNLFNSMELSAFTKNYFGNLSFARFNNETIFLCGSKEQLDVPEKVMSEFVDKVKDKFDGIEVALEEGISSSSPNKINEEKKLKDIESTKSELSNDPDIKDFLDEFDGEIEAITKIKK